MFSSTPNSLLSSGLNLFDSLQGLTQINQGAELSIQGANMEAAQYRTAQASTKAYANYNTAVSRINFNRQMQLASNEISRTMSSQRVAAAASGFAVSSQSFLQAADQTLSTFEREVVQMRNSQTQREKEIQFAAAQQSVGLENQARQAEYQGQIANYQAGMARASSIGSIFNQGVSLLGSLF